MKIFLILFSFYLSFVGRSQIGFSDYYTDTITSDFQTLGPIGTINESLGTLDQSFISVTNSRFFLADNYLNSNGSTIDYLNLVSKDERNYISALPHIGFGYVFGSQGAQHLLFRYGQVLPKNWVINTTIESTKLEGFFRNTSFSESYYGFSLSKQSDKFGLIINGNTDKVEREWSGGVLNDSLLDFFAPQFIPVLKDNCNSTTRGFKGAIGSYLRLLEHQKFNLKYINESSVYGRNRLFNETDTLSGIYENTYFDTLVSRDQYQQSTVDHLSGFRINAGKHMYTAGVKALYWNYRNMGMFRDTLELNIEHKMNLKWNRLMVDHYASYNLLGAFNGWKMKQSVSYKQESKSNGSNFTYRFRNSFGKNMPQVHQRFYLSNNTVYNNSNMKLESYYKQDLSTEYYRALGVVGDLRLSLSYHLGIHRDIYYFDTQNSNWINTSSLSNNTIHQLKFKYEYEKKNLNIRQSYTYSAVNNQKLIMPQHYLYGSFDYKMGLFKDKKMEVILGLNYSLSSKTHVIPILENMGVYDFLNIDTDQVQKGLFNIGVYSAIEIETFRFFLRVNNLGYLWNDLQWNYIENIYLPEVTVRVGITWDFWN